MKANLIDNSNKCINKRMNVNDLEYIYRLYKKGYDDLTKLLNENISVDVFWNIIGEYYDMEIFEDEHSTISDCRLLGIKPKRLNTNFILYEKDIHAAKFYFEDWIVMEQNEGFDARRIYNKRQIDNLIDSERIVPLYIFASRPASKRIEHRLNDYGEYDLYYNGKYVTDESNLDYTGGQQEYVTSYPDWMDIDFNVYNHPDIQKRIIEKVFTKDKIMNDIAYYRFKALEYLKLLRQKAIINDRFNDAIECERDLLIRKLD
ncbi:MAG: hypothetical protein IKR57_05215 [Bacilli bacterium]|nr:hypothetical protein [Bacilli bacterium]